MSYILYMENLNSTSQITYGEPIVISGTVAKILYKPNQSSNTVGTIDPYRLDFILNSDKTIQLPNDIKLSVVKAKIDGGIWYNGTILSDNSFTIALPTPKPDPLKQIHCTVTLYIEDSTGLNLTLDANTLVWGDLLRFIISYMIPTIRDRSQEDVDFITRLHNAVVTNTCTNAEYVQYTQIDWKGALNESDLERIESNITILCDALDIDVTIPQHTSPITTAYFTWLVGIMSQIREKWSIYSTTPQVPEQPLNVYTNWNDIETILYDIYRNLLSNFYYFLNTDVVLGSNIGLLE